MKRLWKDLLSRYLDDTVFIENFYEIIEKKYNSSNRYYHNLDHIEKMLLEVKNFKKKVVDYDSILFAIWFHDIIYDTKNNDNEEKSVEFAEDFLKKINFDSKKISFVKKAIIKTKNHQIDENDDFDTKLFLDLDLLILGAEPDDYWKYVRAIRKEYEFVPKHIFNLERSKILSSLLSQKRLFKTNLFNEKYEKFAKINMQNELRLLKMQKEFIEWLETTKNKYNYNLIEEKLHEIAVKNGYRYVMKWDSKHGLKYVLLIFRNVNNQKFIGAFTSEEGFEPDELDHID